MSERVEAQVAIVGGGPAGMVMGLLLGRAKISTVVLEKHVDFLRDFRGDAVHPSTLEVMYELGLLPKFLERPHQEAREVALIVGGQKFAVADFSHLPAHAKFLALMPQWDFLDFLSREAQKCPDFRLMMSAEVDDLIWAGNRVVGLKVQTATGPIEVHCDLVVGADGRQSVVRTKAGLQVRDLGDRINELQS